ncbi:MAG: hypothetical protein M1819_004394 [Sarea resinae]|nr:MAG: hypothetical protein M1819_004394 [Sarea resinae]
MASLDSAPQGGAPGNPSSSQIPSERGRDGRRGGGRGGRQRHSDNAGPRAGRRGGRGARGNRGGANGTNGNTPNVDPGQISIQPPPGLQSRGNFGARLTGDASQVQGEEIVKGRALVDGDAASEDDSETSAEMVIFTDEPLKRFENFTDSDFVRQDDNLGIKYEKPEIFEDTVLLLRYNCPDAGCDIACLGWPDLHRHVKSVHQKVMCDLCTRNKKVFTHEHELFTVPELRKHERYGDDEPGAVNQSGFKGHPECGFCRQRFYGDDELYVHCRDKHERCHLCDRRNPGRQQQYYVDYNSLEVHFRKDHFLCLDQECLEKKFVVFDSEMDLKAHQLESHPNGLSKDARRDARRVDISGFDYRAPHQSERREGRGRGRGRDPNAEAIPQSSAQPMRRDEIAYQRQMAIQSAQSVSTRTFGGQLTAADASASASAPARPRSNEPVTVTAPRRPINEPPSFPPLGALSLEPNAAPQESRSRDLTPQEQARNLRHAAVIERASALLRNDPMKLSEFRAKISAFRKSSVSSADLIESFFSLFDTSTAELGKLIKELAELYENGAKRNELLKAWNDWRAINEDYPSLPGPSGVLPGMSASSIGGGASRVLKLKSSTARSSRSDASRTGSWGPAASASGATPFPPIMPAGAASSANRAGAGRVGATPWIAPSGTPSRSSPASSRPASRGASSSNRNASDAFPALPAAAKPSSTIFGYGNGAVRREFGNKGPPSASPWGGGVSAGENGAPDGFAGEADGSGAAGKKKGNKNKKQTLFHFG